MSCKSPLHCEKRGLCIKDIGLIHLAECSGIFTTQASRSKTYEILNSDRTRLGCTKSRITGLGDVLNEDVLHTNLGLGVFTGESTAGTQEGNLS